MCIRDRNDGAREGIIVCMERLMNMGIPMNNILIYNLAILLSDGYKRTYSSYISDIPVPFRLMSVQAVSYTHLISETVMLSIIALALSKQFLYLISGS